MKRPNENQVMIILATVYIFASMFALAMMATPAAASDTRVGWMPFSEHYGYGEANNVNEVHRGIFLEKRISETRWAGIMKYTNSFDDPSVAAYVATEFPVTERLTWGYQLGLVTGYEQSPAPFGTLTGSLYVSDNVFLRLDTVPGVVVAFKVGVEW